MTNKPECTLLGVHISISSLPLWYTFHSSIPGKFIALRAQQPLTLFDSGGEAQLASLDLLYGCLQTWGQKLCHFQVQHKLLRIAAKKAYCNATDQQGGSTCPEDVWHKDTCGGREEQLTWELQALSQPLPPLPAEQADLVGHHTLLQLVFRCHRTAHLAGAAFQGSNLHHIVDKGQCEAEAAQDVGVLLLLKGTPRWGLQGEGCSHKAVPATHPRWKRWHLGLKPPYTFTLCKEKELSTKSTLCTSFSSALKAASDSPKPGIPGQSLQKLEKLASKWHAAFLGSVHSNFRLFGKSGRKGTALLAQLQTPPQPC